MAKRKPVPTGPIHVDYMLTIDQLPADCIHDCSAQGSVDEAVAYWLRKLEFTVDRDKTLRCLKGYGAWEWEELQAEDDDTLARRVLWLACCTFKEYQVGGNNAGSDIFVLE